MLLNKPSEKFGGLLFTRIIFRNLVNMKSIELRVGNFVVPVKNEVVNFHTVVLGVLSKGIYIPYNGVPTWFNEIEFNPIPLSNEWMKKFEFERPSEGVFKLGKILVIETTKGTFQLYLKGLDSDFVTQEIDFNLNIEHVHQLQNICFALTGRELMLLS